MVMKYPCARKLIVYQCTASSPLNCGILFCVWGGWGAGPGRKHLSSFRSVHIMIWTSLQHLTHPASMLLCIVSICCYFCMDYASFCFRRQFLCAFSCENMSLWLEPLNLSTFTPTHAHYVCTPSLSLSLSLPSLSLPSLSYPDESSRWAAASHQRHQGGGEQCTKGSRLSI